MTLTLINLSHTFPLPLRGCTKQELKKKKRKRPLPYQPKSQRGWVEKTISSNLTDTPWAYPNYIWVSVMVTSPLKESDISKLKNCHTTLSLSGQSWTLVLLVEVLYLHTFCCSLQQPKWISSKSKYESRPSRWDLDKSEWTELFLCALHLSFRVDCVSDTGNMSASAISNQDETRCIAFKGFGSW